MTRIHVKTSINGEPAEFLADPRETLLDCLRNHLGLTGSKEGCGTGDCGACSVTLDGTLVSSCLVLGVEAEGRRVETIEGMANGNDLHPLQRKFIEHAALQCGFARPASLSRPGRFSNATRTLPKRNCVSGWQGISAGALAMTRSCRLCWMPQPK